MADQPHSRSCAYEIRERLLRAHGSSSEPSPAIFTSIALEIRRHCGHNGVRSFRLAHGWTVQKAIEHLHAMCDRDQLGARGVTDRSWKDWEAGGGLSTDNRDLLCRLFRTGPVQLGFGDDYTPAVDGTALPDSIVETTSDLWGDMHRRTFLGTSAALATGSQVGHVEGLARIIEPPRRSGLINPETVVDLSIVSAAYRRSYRSTPAPLLLNASLAHLELALSMRPDLQPERVQSALLVVVGEMAALAGVIHLLDLGQPHKASRYIRLASSAAKQAKSNELLAIVLGGRSFASGYVNNDHKTGLELAEMACAYASEDTSNETQGWVAAVASERAASLGKHDLCLRYLDSAAEALSAPRRECESLGIGVFGSSKLEAYRGGDMVRLKRYDEAEPALSAAIEHLAPSMQRHRCTALIDRAEARLGAGEVDAACEDGFNALELVTHVHHVGNMKRLRILARRAKETGSVSGRQLWTETLTLTPDPEGSLA